MGITCKMCGTENGDKQKFCSACGKPLSESKPVDASSATSQSKGKSKTMVFGGAAASLGSEPEKPPIVKSAPGGQKTVLGIAAAGGERKIPVATVKTSAPTAKVPPSKPIGGDKARTMLGMAAVTSTGPVSGKAPADGKAAPVGGRAATIGPIGGRAGAVETPKGPAHKSTGSRTVLGMPALNVKDMAAPVEKRARVIDDDTPLDAFDDDEPIDSGDEDEAESGAPVTEAMPSISDSGENAISMKTAPISAFGGEDDEDEDEDYGNSSDEWPAPEEPPKSNGLLVAVIAAGVVAFLVVGALIYLLFFDAAPTVQPQIFPSQDGKSLVVALPFPEAPPGTTVQAVGQSVSVVQGSAQITLPLDQMKLGVNDILLTYLEPGESPEQITFPIVLRHTIKDDLSGLAAEKPFFNVVFQIAPEIQLAVEGKPAQVVSGTYTHKVLIETIAGMSDASADVLMHKVPFQLIDAAGAVEQGEHVVAIPVTKLQIDRPAPNAEVISDSITCAGTVETGSVVMVNGLPAAVTAVGFNTLVPLAEMGNHTISVTARAPGKAPRTGTVKVTRVETFAPAIAEWSKDLDVDLDYPTIGRDPNTHVGKKVKLNGRVVNINTEKGVTAFILYVGQGCPAKSKCAVYVVFKGETDAGLQSWVDVFGSVRGTRAVEMQNGVKIEVPAVDAAYVVKTEPKKNKKK